MSRHGFKVPVGQLRQPFWREFVELAKQQNKNLFRSRPSDRSGYCIAIGTGGFQVCLVLAVWKHKARCELYITHSAAKRAFDLLEGQRIAIEEALGVPQWGLGEFTLEWQRLPHRKSCRIAEYRSIDLEKRDTWSELQRWFLTRAEAFHSVFAPVVRELQV